MLAPKSWKKMMIAWDVCEGAQGTSQDVRARLHRYHDEGEQLGRRPEDGPVLLVPQVELEDVAALEELQDEPRRDYGADAELRERPLAWKRR